MFPLCVTPGVFVFQNKNVKFLPDKNVLKLLKVLSFSNANRTSITKCIPCLATTGLVNVNRATCFTILQSLIAKRKCLLMVWRNQVTALTGISGPVWSLHKPLLLKHFLTYVKGSTQHTLCEPTGPCDGPAFHPAVYIHVPGIGSEFSVALSRIKQTKRCQMAHRKVFFLPGLRTIF